MSEAVSRAIERAAERYGLDPQWLRSIARVESGFNPTASTGSYNGLFQLRQSEFNRVLPGGDISNPSDNAMAAAGLLAGHRQAFRNKFQRDPSLGELYMIHQQGWGGLQAHMANPDRPAWENMASTREGRARGVDWARQAIAGNIPGPERRRHSVDTLTSGQLIEMWSRRLSETPGTTPTTSDPVASVGGPGEFEERGVAPSGLVASTPRSIRAPIEEEPQSQSQASGFFDRQYPVAHAITGRDQPLGQQLLGSIFGGEGLTVNRRLGAGLASVGRELSRPQPLPQVSLPGLGQLPDQDERAFALPQRQRRGYA